jgi:A/G-specific adenine glycosylase
MPSFAESLVRWQRRHGRHDLPWQRTRDPYRIWLSEIMLQQTQVATVIPYYRRFLERFPDVRALAEAQEEEVLRLWSGLGYYARGRNLHAAAKAVAVMGAFPRNAEALRELPGIGRSTAAAIAVFAFGRRAAILDGNVKRVLARRFGVAGEAEQWALAGRLLPRRNLRSYTQALMDLGATVCTRAKPKCGVCPVARSCVARREERISELPARRTRRALPLRRATWYVQVDAGRVLLERRPAKGLWGGLWAFPEKRPPGVRTLQRLPELEHSFTHFRLRARPVLCSARERARPGQLWMDMADAREAAIPTPVRRVLGALGRGRPD